MACFSTTSLYKCTVGAMCCPLWTERSVARAILANYNVMCIRITINIDWRSYCRENSIIQQINPICIYLLWQGCILQFLISNGSPSHLLPPLRSGSRIDRVLPCMPPPQLLVHKSQFVHGPHLQSTKQNINSLIIYLEYNLILIINSSLFWLSIYLGSHANCNL